LKKTPVLAVVTALAHFLAGVPGLAQGFPAGGDPSFAKRVVKNRPWMLWAQF
jgi:hypothetical protein